MDISISSACDANPDAIVAGVADCDGVVVAEADIPDALILRVHRYLWQPARYAHPSWLSAVGFYPGNGWCYGKRPRLDRCLDQAIKARRVMLPLPGVLSARQQRWVHLAPSMESYALALGLLELGCGDYFLLPEYREVIRQWLDDDVIWRLFGLCEGKHKALFSPEVLLNIATAIGSGMLYRAARNEPVLYALLISLPPLQRALWPRVPVRVMNLLEHMLCPTVNCR